MTSTTGHHSALSRRIRTLTYKQASAIVAFIALCVMLAMLAFQDRMTVLEGIGWDIESYVAIVRQFDAGEQLHHAAPFVYRFGTGFLASLIPIRDIFVRYLIIDIAANLITIASFIWWLRVQGVSPFGAVGACALLLLTWHSPIRSVFYASQTPDALFLTVVVLSLCLMHKLRSSQDPKAADLILFSALIMAGTCVRETTLLLGSAALFIHNPVKLHTESKYLAFQSPRAWQFVPFLVGLSTFVIIRLQIEQNNDYDFANAALMWLYNKPFVMYLQGLLLSFGPVLLLLVFFWSTTRKLLAGQQHLSYLLFLFFAAAWFGGTDTERIAYWAAPIVYMLLIRIVTANSEMKDLLVAGLLIVGQLLVMRVVWTTPDMIEPNAFRLPILAVQGSDVQHPHLRAWHNDRMITVMSALQLAAYSVVLWLAVNRARRRQHGAI